MALRSLGSSLLAKSKPGAKFRDVTEQGASRPDLPNKGQVGSISRAGIEEPLTRDVSPGSAKIISQQPTIEGTQVAPSEVVAPASPISPGVGLPPVNPKVPIGAATQALFAGTPAGKATQGVSGKTVSNPGGVATKAGGVQAPSSTPVAAKAYVAPKASAPSAPSVNQLGTTPILSTGAGAAAKVASSPLRSLANTVTSALRSAAPSVSRVASEALPIIGKTAAKATGGGLLDIGGYIKLLNNILTGKGGNTAKKSVNA